MAYTVIGAIGGVGTTGPLNCLGADLIVVFNESDGLLGWDNTDSEGNSYTELPNNLEGRTAYVESPIVSAAQTFDAPNSYSYIGALALAGSAASAFDQQAGNNSFPGTATSLQAQALTPSANNAIVIVGFGLGDNTSGPSIDQGFTLVASVDAQSSVNYGGFMAYLIQTTAAVADPTGSWTGNSTSQVLNNVFLAATGGGGSTFPGYVGKGGWW